MSNSNLEKWLALYHKVKLSAATFNQYLQLDPNLELDYALEEKSSAVAKDLDWLQSDAAHKIITLVDPAYPLQLKNIHNPPPILYVSGDYACLNMPLLAMVGSRRPTPLGLIQAKEFAQQFANLGIGVCSGLAIGIDSASHEGALQSSQGKTVAVLAHGIDQIYPGSNKSLARRINLNGCLVSEFPIGFTAQPWCFPQRNRIISGLSLGVLIVEAAIKSGSLITAKYALDQGREIFAIPGAIQNPQARGCHQLIRDGAKLVESPADVLEELAALLKYAIRDKSSTAVLKAARATVLPKQQQLVLRQIDFVATTVDALASRTGLAVSILGAILFELELNGLVSSVPGGYTRVEPG